MDIIHFIASLVYVGLVSVLVNCQEIQRQQCTYTFKVPVDEFEAQCVTSEIRQSLSKIRGENKVIQTENAELKEQIVNLYKEYGDIIETVKQLKTETATWRQTVEWPVYDTPINPGAPAEIVDQETYNDCYQALRKKSPKKPGIYRLYPKDAQRPFLAYCDENGWTVILRRLDGTQEFDQLWSDYSGGFGELSGEHWLGLEQMHLMTAAKDYQLRVEAIGWNNKMYHGEWDNFNVGDELGKYQLSIGNMTDGNYLDVLSRLDGLMFSTMDSDNDEWYQANCAHHYRSGWWLHNCGFDPTRPWCKTGGCMTWGDLQVKKIVLKIRPMIAKGADKAAANVANVKKNSVAKNNLAKEKKKAKEERNKKAKANKEKKLALKKNKKDNSA